ncbi:uncharacterized protein AB9W97_000060 isoform 2-T4 [Spinachia spinachia]
MSGTPRGVLDLIKESWEEGSSPGKNEIQYVLDLQAKLHMLAKWQGAFKVARRVGDVDYEVVRSKRGGATQIYHLNLLKAWREAESLSLVSTVSGREDLGPEGPKEVNPTPLPWSTNYWTALALQVFLRPWI